MALLALASTARADGVPAGGQRTLHVLTVGITEYPGRNRLPFAAKDARDLARVLKDQKGKMFNDVVCETLTDGQATKQAIEAAFDRLAGRVQKGDLVIVSISGHGNSIFGHWYFLPMGYDHFNIEKTAVADITFQSKLGRLPALTLLLLDTCRAGAAGHYNLTVPVGDDKKDGGLVTFASCMPGEFSHESARWENGAFTKALVEGLLGKADANGDGVVTLAELEAYVSNRTEQLVNEAEKSKPQGARHTQRPSSFRSRAVPSTLPLVRLAGPATTTGTLPSVFGK
jgi:uncharacterized caspase-like protein